MILAPAEIRAVLVGGKTQHRESIAPGEIRPRYAVDQVVAIKRRASRKASCRVRIIDVGSATLGDVTYADARAEGCRTTDEHRATWCERHGLDQAPLSQPVWIYVFELAEDGVRLLHRDSSHGYTSSRHQAMPDEPEAIDAASLARLSERSDMQTAAWRQIEQAHRDRERAVLGLADRLRIAEQNAKARGVDITSEIRVIEKRLRAAERRLDHAA